MNEAPENWQVSVNGQIYEANFEELTEWIAEGALLPQDKVRRGNLRWLEAGKIPALYGFFNAKQLGGVSPPVVTTTNSISNTPAAHPDLQNAAQPVMTAENQAPYAHAPHAAAPAPPATQQQGYAQNPYHQPPPPPQFSAPPAGQPHQPQTYQPQPGYQTSYQPTSAGNARQPVNTEVADEVKKGANWYFWIAGLSLVNSLILSFGGNWAFIAGLAITQFIDGIFEIIALESGTPAVNGIGFVINLAIAAVFVMFGVCARRGAKWAFIVGMILYSIDAVLYLLAGSFLGVAIHAFALICLWRGLQACD